MKKALFILLAVAAAYSCKKNEANPFEVYKRYPPTIINPADTLDPNGFVGIHHNILKPTCANSGCHDGAFEPDYRTIESAYSTLVMQPIIKNNAQGSYKYRVVPGDPDKSVMYKRLIEDIDGMSGIMPLSVDPTSDWNSKKGKYIENIRNWIANGAKDEFGRAPVTVNANPTFSGVFAAMGTGTTPITRGGAGEGEIKIPYLATNVTFYFAFTDDETVSTAFTYNKVKIKNSGSDFTAVVEKDLELISSPFTASGFFTDNAVYTHKITLDMSAYPAGVKQFIRVYVQDTHAQPTEIPVDGSTDYIKTYFSFVTQ